MKIWRLHVVGLACLLAAGIAPTFSPTVARADAPPLDAPVPDTYKSASNLSSQTAAVVALITPELTKLSDPADPDGQGSARAWLIKEALMDGTPSATSSTYVDLYTGTLNQAFTAALANPSTSVHDRVNIAIVTAAIADAVANAHLLTSLQPTMVALLGDKSSAVVLWGQRAAGSRLRNLTNGAGANNADIETLLAALVKSVTDHPEPPIGGDLAETAYRAINPALDIQSSPNTINPAVLTLLVQYNQSLQTARMSVYATGVPERPYCDTFPSVFMLDSHWWPMLTPAQQTEALQLAVNLISDAGRRAAQLSSTQNQELVHTVSAEAGYLMTLMDDTKISTPDTTAVLSVVRSLSPGNRPEVILASVRKVYPMIHGIFPDVTQPPHESAAPSTIPDSATPSY